MPDNYTGLQMGIVNYTRQDSTGVQGGFFIGLLASVVNYTEGTMKGVYSGVANFAGSLRGLELGIFNYAETTDSGFQIGLINVIPQNKSWFKEFPDNLAPAMLLVNWRF